jgi:hypothetical protein
MFQNFEPCFFCARVPGHFAAVNQDSPLKLGGKKVLAHDHVQIAVEDVGNKAPVSPALLPFAGPSAVLLSTRVPHLLESFMISSSIHAWRTF